MAPPRAQVEDDPVPPYEQNHYQSSFYANPTATAQDPPADLSRLAAEHSRLLSSISSLDYAAPALQEQDSYISDLSKQLEDLKQHLVSLEKVTKKEKAESDDLEGSHARRWAYKLSGRKEKFEERASKEHREYVEALEEQLKAASSRTRAENDLAAAKSHRTELSSKVQEQRRLQQQLEALYKRAFDGPTPSFPEEDILEQAFTQAHALHFSAQAVLSREEQALDTLNRAAQAMNVCVAELADARQASSADLWGFGGGFADMMERSALGRAEMAASHVRGLQQQAQGLQPLIGPLPNMMIAQGNVMGDIFFDNVFSDLAFHDKIKQSQQQAFQAQNVLKQQIAASKARQSQALGSVQQLVGELSSARARLDTKRREIFENAVSTISVAGY